MGNQAKNPIRTTWDAPKNQIKNHVKKGNPLLGICLGMQFLLRQSEEFGSHKGLSIIDGKVVKIKEEKNYRLKIPVIGWNEIKFKKVKEKNLNKFKSVSDKKKFYFGDGRHRLFVWSTS